MKRILIVTALVFGLGITGLAAGTFSGSWATDITITELQTPVFGVVSVLSVDYTIAGWVFGSVSRIRGTGGAITWDRQCFRAGGALGAFTITNHLRFVPTPVYPAVLPAFTFLRSAAGVSIAGVNFSSRLLIVEGGSGFRLGFSAPVEDLTFAAGAYFGAYEFDTTWGSPPIPADHINHIPHFRGIDFDLVIPFYSTELRIDVDFATGFQDITFRVPRFPLGIPQFTLDLSVRYTLEAKTVTVTPRFAVGEWLHFQPFISVQYAQPKISGLYIEGLRLRWVVDPAVTFTYEWDSRDLGLSWWLPDMRIAGRRIPRPEFQQRITIAYAEGPIGLTLVGRWLHHYPVVDMPMFPEEIQADLSVDILPGFSVRTGVEFRDPALHSISFGFTVEW